MIQNLNYNHIVCILLFYNRMRHALIVCKIVCCITYQTFTDLSIVQPYFTHHRQQSFAHRDMGANRESSSFVVHIAPLMNSPCITELKLKYCHFLVFDHQCQHRRWYVVLRSDRWVFGMYSWSGFCLQQTPQRDLDLCQ